MTPHSHTILICIGCNTDTDKQTACAKEWLTAHFPGARFTPVVHSAAYGKPSDAVPYVNMLCKATTPLDETSLTTLLHIGEAALGNTKERRFQDIILMDFDLLQYDNAQRHLDDWQRPYVRQLLQLLGEGQ